MDNLVFVWLGNEFPKWAHRSLIMNKKTSCAKIILLANKNAGKILGVDEHYFIEDFYQTPSLIQEKINQSSFRSGFWVKTSERFFVLEAYMREMGVAKFFHAELDNVVINIQGLGDRLDRFGNGLFCPRNFNDRGIASLIYVNSKMALSQFNDMALNAPMSMEENDMTILGRLLQNSPQFISLPTENAFGVPKNWSGKNLKMSECEGIFDAAAIGQYLFGVDPRIIDGPMFNGYINEYSGCDLVRLRYEFSDDLCRAFIQSNDKRLRLYNIHVHSKIFDQLEDPRRVENIVSEINKGNETILCKNLSKIMISGMKRLIYVLRDIVYNLAVAFSGKKIKVKS